MVVDVGLPLVLAFIMFALGLGLTTDDFVRVLAYPKAIIAGGVAQLMLIPLTALALLSVSGLDPLLKFGVMILAFCPGGVVSNIMSKLARGNVALSVSLTGVISLISILTIPLFMGLAARRFLGAEAVSLDVSALGIRTFAMVALPVGLGVAVRRFLPQLSRAMAPSVDKAAFALFVLVAVLAIVSNVDLIIENAAALGPLLLAMNLSLLGVGLLAALVLRLDVPTQTTLAIETGIQNTVLGMTLAGVVAGQLGHTDSLFPAYAMPAAVYGLVFYIGAAPFIIWSRSRRGPVRPA
ncbi:MAG: bile acid:sodium symporter family protein [Pseudomonadota bacterium]